MANGRDKIKARTTAIAVGGDACGCDPVTIPVPVPVPQPPPPPVVVEQPPVIVPKPVPPPFLTKVPGTPQPVPPPPETFIPGTRQPPPDPRPYCEQHPDSSQCFLPPLPPPVFTPKGEILPPEMPRIAPIAPKGEILPPAMPRIAPIAPPRGQCDDPAWVAAHDPGGELCGTYGGPLPDPNKVPPYLAAGPQAVPSAKATPIKNTTLLTADPKVEVTVLDAPVKSATGVGRDKVKARAHSNSGVMINTDMNWSNYSAPTQISNPRFPATAPQQTLSRVDVQSIGLINVPEGAQIYTAGISNGDLVPVLNITDSNGRWVKLREGNSAYLVDYPLSVPTDFIVQTPNGFILPVRLDPNGSEVLDRVAYVDLTLWSAPPPKGYKPAGCVPILGRGGCGGVALPADEVEAEDVYAASSGCGGRRRGVAIPVNEEEIVYASATGCGGRRSNVAPGGSLTDNAKFDYSGTQVLGCPSCGGVARLGHGGTCLNCRAALMPMWVHGPGYASATGLGNAGWIGGGREPENAQTSAECRTANGSWNGEACINPGGITFESAAETEAACRAAGKNWVNGACQGAPGEDADALSERNTGILINQAGTALQGILAAISRELDGNRRADLQREANNLTLRLAEIRQNAPVVDQSAQIAALIAQMQPLGQATGVQTPYIPPQQQPLNMNTILIGGAIGLAAVYLLTKKD